VTEYFSVVPAAGDGLDHEVLDDDIAAACRARAGTMLPTLCGIRIVPERDLRRRLGRRCADCLNARAALDPPPLLRGRNPVAAVVTDRGSRSALDVVR